MYDSECVSNGSKYILDSDRHIGNSETSSSHFVSEKSRLVSLQLVYSTNCKSVSRTNATGSLPVNVWFDLECG
jgi:hypothetical protein